MVERTALVVGASRGLGLGLARELLGRGWRVIATLRSASTASGLTALAETSAGKVRIETLDLEQSGQIDALAERLSAATRDDVARLFVTNTVAPIHVAEAFVERMRDGTGVIAMMSSGLGSVSNNFRGGADLYSASKAALNKLTRGFASGLGDRKLTVLSISPGWVRTDMGGPSAMLSVEESCKGVINLVETRAGTGAHGFYSHDGATVSW
jgi:NAD(P)-dependent dehydrogenase (short-subunit alcohol dehydrogenase family)